MKNSVYNMCRKQEGRLYIHICSSMWKIISSGNIGSFQCDQGQVGETHFSLNPHLCLLKFWTLEMHYLSKK